MSLGWKRSRTIFCSFLWVQAVVCLGTEVPHGPGRVNVLTYHNDLARSGLNSNETALTIEGVNTNTFGRLFFYNVDGQVYTQPLYVSGLVIPGQGACNVIFVATQHNSVYAFDADSSADSGGGLLWQTNLGPSAATPTKDFGNRYGPFHDLSPEVGITSTPVIDLATGTIFVEAFTHEGSSYVHRLHALNITNGTEQPYSPVVVKASIPAIGAGSTNGILTFQAAQQSQRPALTLAGGIVYLAFAGYADTDPYHGWVIGFRASDLQPLANYVFNSTPNSTVSEFGTNAGEAGIWMSGNGLAADSDTNLFLITGNGIFNADTNGTEYGDSLVRLSTANQLAVTDYFTPFNQAELSERDVDFSSGGPLLLPDEVGSPDHPHLLAACGKEGRIYLLDRDHLGGFNAADDSQIVQSLPGVMNGTWGSAAYFDHHIYYQPVDDQMKAFAMVNGLLVPAPTSQSPRYYGYPGATPSISANGTNDGIVWAVQADGYGSGQPAILHAYAATNLAVELYNSSLAGDRDTLGPAVKFAVPTIANGKVYVGSSHQVTVFGCFVAAPQLSPAGGLFTNSVTVTVTEPTPDTSVYYTVDGSTPTAGSTLYTGPITLTNTAVINLQALKPGVADSSIVSALFVNCASATFTTDFLRQEYFPGQTRAELESGAAAYSPELICYLTSFETPADATAESAERVCGYFIPPKTGSYVFFLCADGDADLFLSTDATPAREHLIASETVWSKSREWTKSSGGSSVAAKRSDRFAGSTWPGGHTITLTNGHRYYLEGIHHHAGSSRGFAATFKLSTEPDPVNGVAPRLTGNLIAADAYDNTAVAITSPPADVSGAQGGTATFQVSAVSGYLGAPQTSGPPLGYQWQLAPPGASNFTSIRSATGSAYAVRPLLASQDGTHFRVMVSSIGASVTSAVATLTVGQAPSITSRPASLVRDLGAPAAFAVTALGTPPLSYRWLRGQTVLADDTRISGASESTLTINAVQMSDAGSYFVVISNRFGSATSKPAATLVVRDHSAPALSITSHTNLEVLATNRITLAGTASDAATGGDGIVSVTVNGLAATHDTAVGAGTANWSRSLLLTPGTNTIRVVATDTARNSTSTIIRLICTTPH